MTPEEIRAVLSRIDGIWPPRQAPTQEERREWVVFLKTLEGPLCLEALDEMRPDCRWRPSMAELRDHYDEAALRPIGTMLALPSAKTAAPHSDYGLTYGHNREQWVYCWKCDMAISLEQQEVAYWDELRRRHLNMLMDTCASGGHRNDLETLRRSVPLLRSDYTSPRPTCGDVLAQAGTERRLRIVEARGAAADHPTLPGFPEGRYLKLLVAV